MEDERPQQSTRSNYRSNYQYYPDASFPKMSTIYKGLVVLMERIVFALLPLCSSVILTWGMVVRFRFNSNDIIFSIDPLSLVANLNVAISNE